MTRTQVLPLVLIFIDLGASGMCLIDADFRRAVYWFAAAVLTASVTF